MKNIFLLTTRVPTICKSIYKTNTCFTFSLPCYFSLVLKTAYFLALTIKKSFQWRSVSTICRHWNQRCWSRMDRQVTFNSSNMPRALQNVLLLSYLPLSSMYIFLPFTTSLYFFFQMIIYIYISKLTISPLFVYFTTKADNTMITFHIMTGGTTDKSYYNPIILFLHLSNINLF